MGQGPALSAYNLEQRNYAKYEFQSISVHTPDNNDEQQQQQQVQTNTDTEPHEKQSSQQQTGPAESAGGEK